MPGADTLRAVVIDAGYDDYDQERELLAAIGVTLDVFDGDRHDRAGKNAFAAGADGMFVRWTEIDGAFLDAASRVRAIVRYGVGYDNINLEAASARGVPVCNVQGYANHSVSDHALALMFACVRGLRIGSDTDFLHRQYAAPPRDRIPELRNMTLGIIGLGRIGGTLSAKAKGLFRRVLACDPYIAPERFDHVGAVPCDLGVLLRESDIVSMHCNLTNETRRLIGCDALAQMKPSAIVINTSRGPVVDEDALLDALVNERLYAAGLDCFWDEPPLANRDALLAHPHLVATGHYAWFSTEASRELQRRGAENMVEMLQGRVPEDCLNPTGRNV